MLDPTDVITEELKAELDTKIKETLEIHGLKTDKPIIWQTLQNRDAPTLSLDIQIRRLGVIPNGDE